MLETTRLRRWIVAALVCTPAIACSPQRGDARQAPKPVEPPKISPVYSEPPPEPARLADVIDRVLPAVVSVASTRVVNDGASPFDDPELRELFGGGAPREQGGLGSGVIVSSDTILTNAHVVEGATSLEVTTSDGRELDVDVAGTDPKSDLAVLRVRGDVAGLHPIELGSSITLRLGDGVLAVGNPFGVGATVTRGIVSALGRANVGITEYEDFIQTDAAINPGNSGGALIALDGTLVGIPTAIVSRSGGSAGIGFAIPTDMARPIMQSLLDTGKVTRSWLGVSIQNVDDDLAHALGLPRPEGVVISGAAAGGPAERGGLKRGDAVMKVDGVGVRTVGELRNRIAAAGVGKTVRLELVRDGKPMTLDVVLGELPAEPAKDDAVGDTHRTGKPAGIEGLAVAPLDAELRRRLSAPAAVDGVVITDVTRGSAAARAGLQLGDIILEVDHRSTRDPEDLRKALAGRTGALAVLVWRDQSTLYLAIEP